MKGADEEFKADVGAPAHTGTTDRFLTRRV